ncbi:MAG: hydrolase Nlp/P60 [Lachnospiraceae bacterium]|jgi:Cell wall-associated hydrolases (invasion-associated proteins)|nr:hydrolase Nlp/P60 [Lachnospiraceae bacterium]
MKKKLRYFVLLTVCTTIFTVSIDKGFYNNLQQVCANKIDELKQQNEQDQEQLDDIGDKLDELTEEQSGVDKEITALSDQIAEIMASISILEEEIEQKKADIVQAQQDLENAKKEEATQYDTMKARIKVMYESGDSTYLDILFSSNSMEDLLNKADYVEKMHQYDRKVYEDYQAARHRVEDLKEALEQEESELEAAQGELQEEMNGMEESRAELEAISADYAVQISRAKNQAEVYKARIKQQNAQIKKLEEEERKRREEEERKRREEEERKKREEEERKRREEEERKKREEEAKKNADGDAAADNNTQNDKEPEESKTEESKTASKNQASTDAIATASGSAKGKEIANYACQFIGNPYVSGGTSLTKGTDCSGFTQSVYKQFGYSLPRNSYSQRSAGKQVSYAEAQPGDIICYAGHVAIYIGNGKIVHASTPKSGIKISNALYRDIISVRRII